MLLSEQTGMLLLTLLREATRARPVPTSAGMQPELDPLRATSPEASYIVDSSPGMIGRSERSIWADQPLDRAAVL